MQRKFNRPTYDLLHNGGAKSFKIFYERYGQKLHYYGSKIMKIDEDDAWDIVYRTLYKVKENIDKNNFESEKKFSSFVLTCYINYGRNYFRDTKKITENLQFTHFHESLFEEELNSTNLINQKIKKKLSEELFDETDSYNVTLLKSELDKLEDWQRILLLLRAQDLPYSEIEKFVDKPKKTLKVYYQRLKNKLEIKLNGKLVFS